MKNKTEVSRSTKERRILPTEQREMEKPPEGEPQVAYQAASVKTKSERFNQAVDVWGKVIIGIAGLG